MPGMKIEINTKEAERASKLLRKELGLLGHEAINSEKDFNKLEHRLLKGMGAAKAKKTVDHLTHSLQLSRLETAKLQAKTGNLSGAFKTLVGRGKAANSMMGMMAKSAALLAGAYGVKKVADSFIYAADTAEGYRTRLNILLRSQKEGNRMFKEMADYAGRVPFEYEKVMQSATALAGVMRGGVDEVKQWMPLIGDLAVASGLSIEETTSQMIKMYSAGASAADMFRERGILAMLGFTAGVKYSAEDTRAQLMRAWKSTTSQFRGATGAMAKNWQGMVSMLKDAWFQFRVDVMDSGIFDAMKEEITGLLKKLKELKEDGTLKKWAKGIADDIMTIAHNLKTMAVGFARHWGTIKSVFTKISGQISTLVQGFMAMPSWMQETGILGSLMFGMKGAAVLATISYIAAKVKKLHEEEFSAYNKNPDMMQAALDQSAREMKTLNALTGSSTPEEMAAKFKAIGQKSGEAIAQGFQMGMKATPESAKANKKAPDSFLQGPAPGMFSSLGAKDYAKESQGVLSGLFDPKQWDTNLEVILTYNKEATEEISKEWTSMNEAMADSFETGFSNLFINGLDNIGDSFKEWGNMIVESFARTVAQMVTQWLFFDQVVKNGETTNVAGGLVGSALKWIVRSFHTGGVVGQGSPATKTVHPAVFAGAKRYHNGLAGDEFPAILQKGETVLPKGTTGAAPNVAININNNGAAVDAETQGAKFDGEKWVFDILLKAQRRGSPQSKQLRMA